MSKDPKEVREHGMQTPGVNVVQVEGPAHAKALSLVCCVVAVEYVRERDELRAWR